MPPRTRTRSTGWPAAESLGGGTGERVGRGGRGRGPREGNDERVDDLNGQGNDQGMGANGGVKGVNGNVEGANEGAPDFSTIIAQQLQNLLPAILAQVSNRGNVGNQNGNVVNENIQENVRNVLVNGNRVGCSYKEFLACNPKEYDGKGGVVVLTRWNEKMEYVHDMSGCSIDQKVKYTAGSFMGKALTWWNSQIYTLSREVAISMSWNDFKFRMIQEFCPSHEMQKLKSELWNHVMVGAGHAAYTDRFHELASLVSHLVTPESRMIERYVYGLAPQIRGMVAATEPKTIQKVVQIFGALTDEAVRNGSIKKVEKRGNVGEPSKDKNGRDYNKRTRNGNAFATTVNPVGRENTGSGYQQKDRKPSQNDKTEHGMEKTVQNQGQSPKMSKSESILKNQQLAIHTTETHFNGEMVVEMVKQGLGVLGGIVLHRKQAKEPSEAVEFYKRATTQPEPELRKTKMNRTPKDFEPEFQLYLIKGTRDKKEAINDEMDSIMGNNNWVLADLPPGCKPLGCKWIFKRKLKVDGTIKKFKARLVIQGFKQNSGIDYFDTYVPVARISTIRLLIAMASIHNLIIHQMDVKIAFLNGDLEEEQTPKQWHQMFDEVVLSNGYLFNQANKCVYSKFDETGKRVIICLYVDDMLIFGTDQVQVDLTKECLSSRFYIKDMREADVILGIRIKHESNGIVISRSHYIEKAVSQLEYFRVIGCLMYAMTYTRPGIAFVMGKLSMYTSNPGTQHWQAIQRMYNGNSRHLGVRHSMIRELITNGVISIEFVRSQQNLVDHLTKIMARDLVIKSVEGFLDSSHPPSMVIASEADLYPVYQAYQLLSHCFSLDKVPQWLSQSLGHPGSTLVATVSNQQHSVDIDEDISLVLSGTCRTVLALLLSRQWPIHQLDVKNAFLNEVFLWVWKHATSWLVPAWVQGSQVAYLLIYVDDIILTASSPVLLQQIVDSLHKELDMTDLGLLERAHMVNCNRRGTLLTDSKLGRTAFSFPQDPTLYRSLAGGLQYLTLTRLDLSYAVQQLGTRMLIGRLPFHTQSTYVIECFKVITFVVVSKRKHHLSRSSAEAEYGVLLMLLQKTAWIRNLLSGHVWIFHVPSRSSRFQYADIFTKGLPSALFEDFRSSLSVRPPPAPTAGAY
ncbi:reverse transcriptase domain-containing protein [Tanacetum coccineum]